MARRIGFAVLGLVGLGTLYLLLLCFPQPLFAHRFTQGDLTLYCDEPIPPEAGAVLRDVERRLATSPLFHHQSQALYLCQKPWRYKLFANLASRGGGVTYDFWPYNAFLRKADVSRNVLFRGDGTTPSGPDRPLAYFMAHEAAHALTFRTLGFWESRRLPSWIREGYADYVGKGGEFDFRQNLALFLKGDSRMDPRKSGLYLRYHLLVAELLDHRQVTVDELLNADFNREKLESELRGE